MDIDRRDQVVAGFSLLLAGWLLALNVAAYRFAVPGHVPETGTTTVFLAGLGVTVRRIYQGAGLARTDIGVFAVLVAAAAYHSGHMLGLVPHILPRLVVG